MDKYSPTREYKGVLREEGGEREVPLLGIDVHPKNEVRVYKAWEHNVEETLVLALTITQHRSANINSVYVIRDGKAEEITTGFSRTSSETEFGEKMTKDDVIAAAEEWMRSHPDGH